MSVLHCPYPECPGVVADLSTELIACPTCHRLAARCGYHDKQGRCRGLNRPLARFCRRCGKPLGRGWARSRWALDLGDAAGARLGLGAPEVVVDLEDHFSASELAQGPPELAEMGGRLFVGGPGGRFLLVEPFRDRDPGRLPVVIGSAFGEFNVYRVHGQADGLWALLTSEHGIKGMSLLALDDPAADRERTVDLFASAAGGRLATYPVLLRGVPTAGDPAMPRDVAAWIVSRPDGPALRVAILPPMADDPVDVQEFRLSAPGLGVGADESISLVVAPLGSRDGLIVGTNRGLWLIDAPLPAPAGRSVEARPLASGRTIIHGGETPGLVCLPTDAVEGAPAAPGGSAFVALEDEARPGIPLLHRVGYREGGPSSGRASPLGPGLPLAPAESGAGRQALCLDDRALFLVNASGQRSQVVDSQLLRGATRGHASGRLAICSGRDNVDGRDRWFYLIADTSKGLLLHAGLRSSNRPIGHPLAIGGHLFAVEPGPGSEDQPGPVVLVRRRVVAVG